MDQLIKSTSFGRCNKILKLSENQLLFGNQGIILKSVTDIKYGIEPIQLDMYYVGRKYIIDLKSKEDKLKIVFKSYFGISRRYFDDIFTDIIENIWSNTAVRIIDYSINQLLNNNELRIGKCLITKKGIICKDFLIHWDDLSYQRNYNRLTINSKSNSKIWTDLFYLEEYNAEILMHILDWIYLENGLYELGNDQQL